jgi:hypothetical protein
MFTKKEPRKIFGTTGVEVIGDWRNLHNEEIDNFIIKY